MLDKLFEMAKDYDMLVMDESVYAIKSNLLDEEKLITHLEEKPVGLEVVLAGRNPSQKLMDHSDKGTCKTPVDRTWIYVP